MPAFGSEDGSLFVLDDVVPFEPAGAVYRGEPAADVAERADRAADAPEDDFAHPVGFSAELLQHAADELAVMPFVGFDLADARSVGRVAHAVPMTAIGVTRGQLARVRSLQLADEFCAGVG